MKFALGNEKLGECMVVSRPVGDSCPSSCPFLGDGCYAEKTEKRFPNARVAGFENMVTDKNKIRAMLILASKQGKSVRFHERGDFGENDTVDMEYVKNIEWACLSLWRDNIKLPTIWTYTHFYDKRIVQHLSAFMNIYASVHNEADLEAAKSAGFTLFAWGDRDGRFPKKGKKPVAEAPKLTILGNENFITCPEMRRGRTEITCTGSKDTIACQLCCKGLANVLFLSH